MLMNTRVSCQYWMLIKITFCNKRQNPWTNSKPAWVCSQDGHMRSWLQGGEDDDEDECITLPLYLKYSGKDTITTITITNKDNSEIKASHIVEPCPACKKCTRQQKIMIKTITITIKTNEKMNTGHSVRPSPANSEHWGRVRCRRRLLLLQVNC